MKMNYQKPEAELKDFAAMESNATMLRDVELQESTSAFGTQEGVENRG